MGYDFSAVDGPAYHRAHGVQVTLLLNVLAEARLLDYATPYPDEPESVAGRAVDPDAFEDDEDWPLSSKLPADEIAYFGFGSPDPTKVPACKFFDNSPWLITESESLLLADGIDLLITGAQPGVLNGGARTALTKMGVDREQWGAATDRLLGAFGAFCRACATSGGFWAY